jgi:F-box/WD-40 domain protein MET30
VTQTETTDYISEATHPTSSFPSLVLPPSHSAQDKHKHKRSKPQTDPMKSEARGEPHPNGSGDGADTASVAPTKTSQPPSAHPSSILTQYMKNFQGNLSPDMKDMRRYCYRHHPDLSCSRESDEECMAQIQRSMDELPVKDREGISHCWSIFSASNPRQRSLILQGILTQCCFPQLSQVSSILKDLIRIDFISALPTEVAFKILCYLDTASLCRAAQVSKRWKMLADDDVVWYRMCEQHIDKKCTKCGWGLPLLDKKRLQQSKRSIELRAKNFNPKVDTQGQKVEDKEDQTPQEKVEDLTGEKPSSSSDVQCGHKRKREDDNVAMAAPKTSKTRPWKEVYGERYMVERNWRTGKYSVRKFSGHKLAIMCLQFNHQFLITGSYDTTVKVWCVETGRLIRTLEGHRLGVRALMFDDTKLITGSLDHTIRIWNYRTGQCVCTFRGHENKVLAVDFNDSLIVSGSADKTVKVWNFETKSCFTLRGHTDYVNDVKIHSASGLLFSASDDNTVRVWDLETKRCLRVFGHQNTGGHVHHIQSVIPLTLDHLEDVDHLDADESAIDDADASVVDEADNGHESAIDDSTDGPDLAIADGEIAVQRNSFSVGQVSQCDIFPEPKTPLARKHYPTHMLTGSLDNTIKLWDIKTGKCVRTLFGHAEGVWSIAADHFRVISASHDKTVKVWELHSGRYMHTFGGYREAVTCVAMSDCKFVTGCEDGVARLYNFDMPSRA